MPFSSEVAGNELKVLIKQDLSDIDFQKITGLIKEHGKAVRRVSIDLKSCSYIQSRALSQLIALKKQVGQADADLRLTNVGNEVYQVLEMTNLLPIFQLASDFSSYNTEELVNLFTNSEMADKASDYLATNYTDEVRTRLSEVLASGDSLKREYAALTIGKAHDTSQLERIRRNLTTETGNVMKASMLVLGWFGDVASKEKIYPYLKSEHFDIAEVAAAAIALLSDDSDALRLKELAESADERFRRIAVQALALINDDTSFTILLERLAAETDENLKALIARKISVYNKAQVGDVLMALLDDPSLIVREAAASGLIRIRAKDKAPEILSKVTHTDSWVGYFATKALAEICDGSCAAPLIEAYPSVEQHVKLAIIEALGKIPKSSNEFLTELLKDDNEDVRKEALTAIAHSDVDTAVSISKLALAKDPGWLVRFKAVDILNSEKPEGYIQILKDHLKVESNKYVKDKIMSILGA